MKSTHSLDMIVTIVMIVRLMLVLGNKRIVFSSFRIAILTTCHHQHLQRMSEYTTFSIKIYDA